MLNIFNVSKGLHYRSRRCVKELYPDKVFRVPGAPGIGKMRGCLGVCELPTFVGIV